MIGRFQLLWVLRHLWQCGKCSAWYEGDAVQPPCPFC